MKICIVGNSGAGKSVLAGKLAGRLAIPLFTVDKIYWQPGWVLRDEAAFNRIHDKWLENDAWLIDGVGYWQALEKRFSQADRIVFLDFPVDVCLERAIKRIEDEEKMPNPDIVKGCRYGDVCSLQIRTIKVFHDTHRPRLKALIADAAATATVHRFTDPDAMDQMDFLRE